MRIIRLKPITSAALMAALFTSCFTGIESTPRISNGDVRRRDAAGISAEQEFLSSIKAESPSHWTRGKHFYVTDDKISIIFTPGSAESSSLGGCDLVFDRFEDVPSVTGEGATQVVFSVADRDGEYYYQVDAPTSDINKRERLEIPFTIERSIVEAVDSAMRGNTYYISTPKWFAAYDNKAVTGQRHVAVTITHVEPGTHIYPLKIYFHRQGENAEQWIPMTVGSDHASTRNFDAVFNFNDPRKRYPQISDETWELITNSRVREGMTRDECRLALGAPNNFRTIPVTNAIVEQWSYDDGVYLIFEDGILTRYRI